MKLKKGSAAAKAFMAKIRAKRKTKTTTKRKTKQATFKPLFKKKAAKKKSAAPKKSNSFLNGINQTKSALITEFINLQKKLIEATKAIDKRRLKKEIAQVKKKYNKLNKI